MHASYFARLAALRPPRSGLLRFALTDYSELDVSKIPDLPPGRTPVRTWVKPESRRDEIYQLIRDQLDAGRQTSASNRQELKKICCCEIATES